MAVAARANFVNLGRLYSVPRRIPRTASHGLPSRKRIRGEVNLGDFYTPVQRNLGGCAYLEDGSLFVQIRQDLSHKTLEGQLNLIRRFIIHAPQKLRQSREQKLERKFLIIQKEKLRNGKREVMVRTALDGQAIVDGLFYYVDVENLEILKKGGRIAPAGLPGVRKALHTFRGTLIDETLQPNVRLGNGLALQYILRSPKVASDEQPQSPTKQAEKSSQRPKDAMVLPKVAAKLRAQESFPKENQDEKEIFDLVNDPKKRMRNIAQPERKDFTEKKRQRNTQKDRFQSSRPKKRIHDKTLRQREKELSLREQQLQLREEILRWKHKNMVLNQRLSSSASNAPSPSTGGIYTSKSRARNGTTTGIRHAAPGSSSKRRGPHRQIISKPSTQADTASATSESGHGDLLSSVGNATPDSLAGLNARIRLPTKGHGYPFARS